MVRRNPPRRRNFLNNYMDTLVENGFLKPNADAFWQAALHLVPKSSEAQYQMTTDLSPVNPATMKKSWPIPSLDLEMQDFEGSKRFSTLNFSSGYWKTQIYSESYISSGLIFHQETCYSTPILQNISSAV